MRCLVLLLPLALMAVEPPRWAAGQGTVHGVPATLGQDLDLPVTLVAQGSGARIDLGHAPGGEVLLAPGARAVLSQEDGQLLLNLAGAAQITRTTATGDLRLRVPTAEVEIAPGVVLAEVLPTGAVVMALHGDHRTRPTGPDQPRAAWSTLTAGAAAALEARGPRLLGQPRRPQMGGQATLADQIAGRSLAPTGLIAGLADEDRDDLALAILQATVPVDRAAAFRHLRFLASHQRPMALVGAQAVLAVAPDSHEEVLLSLVDGGIPADRAAGIVAFAVPERAVDIARRALLLAPAQAASIRRLVAAAAPAQAAAVEALPGGPAQR